MENASYGYTKSLGKIDFAEAEQKVVVALKSQGFGVLTEIDVQATMREKLGEETGPYLILGACNPPLAHRGLSVEPSLGLLLPCNVTVRRPAGEQTVVEVVDPSMLVELSGNSELAAVAEDATTRLRAALDATSAALAPATA